MAKPTFLGLCKDREKSEKCERFAVFSLAAYDFVGQPRSHHTHHILRYDIIRTTYHL